MTDIDPNKDRRKINKGLVCTSMNISKSHKYFPSIDTKLHKKNYCNELLFTLCEIRNKTEKKSSIHNLRNRNGNKNRNKT